MRPIDADELKKWVEEYHASNWGIPQDELIYAIGSAPTIEPKPGRWIDGKRMGFDGCFVWHRECSLCGYEREDDNPDKDTNYCPNCGAKMERSEE